MHHAPSPRFPAPFRLAWAVSALLVMAGPVAAQAQGGGALGEVQVTDAAAPTYQPAAASLGPLGDKPVRDTPYSVQVVPAELLENQQLKSVREAFRYLPSVQGENIRPQTRGLQAGVVQNTRIDGMNIAATTDYPIEQFDHIEVLYGLAGALYGPASPAGTINYVLKRPTADTVRRVTVGYATQGSRLVSVDLGGAFDEGKRFGYRVNLLDESGEGYVDRSNLDRKLASVSFDARFSANTWLETNASRYHYTSKGFPGTFALANNVVFPATPDPKRVGYGQPFGGDDNVTDTLSARLKHRFDADWLLTVGLLRQDSDRASTVPTLTLTNNSGAYNATTATTTFSLDSILSNTIALNGRVRTGGITHDLVFSNTGFVWDRYQPFQTGAITLGTSNLANPATFNAPAFPDFKSRYKSLATRQQSLTVGDTVGFNEQWSAGLFVSNSHIEYHSISRTGATTNPYKADGTSVNATLTYKPRTDATLYGSYADSLQQGDIAPAGTARAGTGLEPFRSKQWELGYKHQVDKLLLGVALFRITRPFAFTDTDNVFKVKGDQVNKGLEFTASGALGPNLAVYSGLTYLDPRVFNTGSAATSDKRVLGLSRVVASLLLDYRVAAVPGLSANLFISSASSRPGNNTNTFDVGGFTTADIGMRYITRILNHGSIWRLSINNLTDARYWANITPTGQNGYAGTGNGTGTLGAPRTLRASAQFDF